MPIKVQFASFKPITLHLNLTILFIAIIKSSLILFMALHLSSHLLLVLLLVCIILLLMYTTMKSVRDSILFNNKKAVTLDKCWNYFMRVTI